MFSTHTHTILNVKCTRVQYTTTWHQAVQAACTCADSDDCINDKPYALFRILPLDPYTVLRVSQL